MQIKHHIGRRNQQRVRLLSYNIQAGVDTRKYSHYVTQSWKHVLPHKGRLLNLNRIASIIGEYDVVGLQEVDSGSLRSGFIDQIEYLSHQCGFPFSHKQVNRSLGKLAQYSNGLLSRMRPTNVSEYKLPGLPGRGAMICQFGNNQDLTVCIIHLALSRRARLRQLGFIAEIVKDMPQVVIMGDLNCSCDSHELSLLMAKVGLQEPLCDKSTFPSWRPMRKLDHILVSQSLVVENARVVNYPLSDHLPIGIDVVLPLKEDVAA